MPQCITDADRRRHVALQPIEDRGILLGALNRRKVI